MDKIPSISDAELDLMWVLWQSDKPMKVQEVCAGLKDKKWKYNTVATLLGRMAEKGSVTMEKKERAYVYSPAVSMEDYKKFRTKSLISKLYNGSARELAVSLFKGDDLTREDIEDIRRMFEL